MLAQVAQFLLATIAQRLALPFEFVALEVSVHDKQM